MDTVGSSESWGSIRCTKHVQNVIRNHISLNGIHLVGGAHIVETDIINKEQVDWFVVCYALKNWAEERGYVCELVEGKLRITIPNYEEEK